MRVNIIIFCLTISWAISHLGRNPVSGGNPLSERRESIDRAVSAGVLDQEVDNSYMFFVFRDIKVRNSVDVIRTYRKKFIRVNCGEIFRIATIQPKWATDEKASTFRI